MVQTKRRKKLSKRTLRSYLFCYAYLALPLISLGIFYFGVNINSILLAFQKLVGTENGSNVYEWSFYNFQRLFNEFKIADSELYVGFFNTLKYFAMNLFVMTPLSFIISYFLYKKILGYKAFRVILFLPSIVSGVVFVSMYKSMWQPFGPLDEMMTKWFGRSMPNLLGQESTATLMIMLYCVWTGLGGNMILYSGAMSRIPEEVIESGKLEGIKWFRELRSIVLPMVWPTFSMTIIMLFSGLFTASGPILLFSGSIGNATNKTTTLSYYIFAQTYYGHYEYPAAIGLFFTVCALPIVFGINWLMNKIDPEVEY